MPDTAKPDTAKPDTTSAPANHLTWQQVAIGKADRQQRHGHASFVIWFTGLSGSGKSTLANALEQALFERGVMTYVLDGDNIRHGLCRDLGFSDEDRVENIRRIGEVARLFVDAGSVVLTAFISPFERDRQLARSLVADHEFFEVYVKCALAVCESRDPKGLYKKARAGQITQFTGIDSPYEPPVRPDLVVETDHDSVQEAVGKLLAELETRQLIQGGVVS
ncbi:MAG: adenylyl-sulfate kinase [Cyanobacteria bacterium HKST-UBA04]|nr:adenylyl-sulfate kinase [Cyanobacteria bacterium HKST-UBA04]